VCVCSRAFAAKSERAMSRSSSVALEINEYGSVRLQWAPPQSRTRLGVPRTIRNGH